MPFSQSKATYKVSFITNYKDIEIFEQLMLDDSLGVSCYEVHSTTINSMPDDIWCYEIYLAKQLNLRGLKNQIIEFASSNNLTIPSNITLETINDQDWVTAYQQNLKPLEVGRFFISSRIHKNICPTNKTGIFIDAARAFGTGEHHTTSGCIEGLEQLANFQFKNILDIGTGTGILSFAAAHIWPEAQVLGCDIEEIAVEIARNNAEFNNSNAIFYQNSEAKILLGQYKNNKFDLIISNILAAPLIALSSQIRQLSESNAYVILSGFLDHQLPSILTAFEKHQFQLYKVIPKESWIVLILKLKVN